MSRLSLCDICHFEPNISVPEKKKMKRQALFDENKKVNEGLSEAVRSWKPQWPSELTIESHQSPTPRSPQLAEVDVNFSEKAIMARAMAKAYIEKRQTFECNRCGKWFTKRGLASHKALKPNCRPGDSPVNEGLSEAIRSWKQQCDSELTIESHQSPTRRSHRLAEVDVNYSEEAIMARAMAKESIEKRRTFQCNRCGKWFTKGSLAGHKSRKPNCSPGDSQKKMKRHASFDENNKDDGPSEYEKMIQKNKDEKLAFLKSLKIIEIKEDLREAIQSLKPQTSRQERLESPQAPTRQSHRLSEVDINFSEKAVMERAISKARRDKELPAVLPFEEAIKPGRVYKDFENDFDNLDFKTSLKSFHDYVSHFEDMKFMKSRTVVNGRITSVAIHPTQEKVIVSTGNIHGCVSFWNVNSNSRRYKFQTHLQEITNLRFHQDLPNMIISSSYDGTMRWGDIEKKIFSEIYNISDKAGCTYFDFLSSTTFLVSQSNGDVAVVDNRSQCKISEKRHKCHGSAVKTVSVHPRDKNFFISADVEGNFSLWDLRMLQKRPVIKVRHHKETVYSAFFSPVTGNNILTTAADDTICLFDSSTLGQAIKLKKVMPHCINPPNSWSPDIQATWLPNTDDAFVVGSMLTRNRIQIFNDSMNNIFNFSDTNSKTSTACVNQFHPHLPVLVSAHISGKVIVFAED